MKSIVFNNSNLLVNKHFFLWCKYYRIKLFYTRYIITYNDIKIQYTISNEYMHICKILNTSEYIRISISVKLLK